MSLVRASGIVKVVSLALVLALAPACERAPSSQPDRPGQEPSAPPSEPAPEPSPSPAPTPAPAPTLPEPSLELPAVAGIEYLEVVTGDAQPDAALPMIVAFHGNGAFPRLMEVALLEDLGTRDQPADPFARPARFIFMRGTLPVGPPGYARWFTVTANEARESEAAMAELGRQIRERCEAVTAAIEALGESRPTVGKPIITGHSQGGILTFGLAITHPEAFEAAYPVAGWLPGPLWPKQGPGGSDLPIVALHGSADTVVDFGETKAAVEHLERLGYPITLHAFPGVEHTLSPMLAKLRELLAQEL